MAARFIEFVLNQIEQILEQRISSHQINFKFNLKIYLESLIVAQNERWRRA
jgi:hypothetical protein